MWFESQEGVGSVFYFTVTFELSEPSRTHRIPKMVRPVGLPEVFVVSKCRTLVDVLARKLSFFGFTPRCFGSAAEAAAEAPTPSDKPPNVVALFVDANEGEHAIYDLKQIYNRIVVMGYPNQNQGGYSAFPFLKKPVREKTLVTFLEEFCLAGSDESESSDGNGNGNGNGDGNDNMDTSSSDNRSGHTLRMTTSCASLSLRSLINNSRSSILYQAKILLAEDNVMNQRVITKILESLGYANVTLVENGRQAWEAAKETNYDVILMDCMVRCAICLCVCACVCVCMLLCGVEWVVLYPCW